ncbi:MAG: hypothetical protein IPK19_03310 [Chloroflexi bacterium]|nr:hypothetical protein [Chloroflexota bacterium]
MLWEGQPVDDRYSTDQWADGEIVADRVRWRIPLEMPAGDAAIVLSAGSQEIVLGTLSIADLPRLFEPPPYEMPFNATFGGQITLLGATLDEDTEALRLTLIWRAERAMAQDVKLFVHLLDAADNILTQVDQMPLDNTYPTSLWVEGEIVVDEITLPALPGGTTLRLGWYDPQSGDRLPASGEMTEGATESLTVDLEHHIP